MAKHPWKKRRLDSVDALGEDGGLLEVDELEGYDVVYEDGRAVLKKSGSQPEKGAQAEKGAQNGRGAAVAKDTSRKAQGHEAHGHKERGHEAHGHKDMENSSHQSVFRDDDHYEFSDSEESGEASSSEAASESEESLQGPDSPASDPEYDESLFDTSEMPGWASISLPNALLKAIRDAKLSTPTPIQAAVLDTLPDQDIVGIAQTGSGKTLAYGLPILEYLLKKKASQISAVIMSPTRELAMQVKNALTAVAARLPKRINIVAITGGMNIKKQQRQLAGHVDILVATPGRLSELISQDKALAKQIAHIAFLVVDEADRMIQPGHFKEMESILGLTHRTSFSGAGDKDEELATLQRSGFIIEDSRKKLSVNPRMRTFVMSATMSKELQSNLSKGKRAPPSKKEGSNSSSISSLEDLMSKIDFRHTPPVVIDLSPESRVSSTITEFVCECPAKQKDTYLYHFLVRYEGRSLIFVSSIDQARRLKPLLSELRIPTQALHAGMQQRARLKALDYFKSSPNGVLVTTDVAARGLDIPAVKHVIHYNLPRSADTYIHRSGRTGRANERGAVLLLVSPDEKAVQNRIFNALNRPVAHLQPIHVNHLILPKLDARLNLAKSIEKAQHQSQKASHEDSWLAQAAKDMDLDVGAADGPTKKDKAHLASLRAHLADLLKQPILPQGSRRDAIENIVFNTGHSQILGLSKKSLLDE